MNVLLYIARRFAFRERTGSRPAFIVLAAVAGIAVGTAALILTLSVVKGFAVSIENKIISFTSHIQLRSADEEFFPQSRYHQRLIGGTSGVVSAAPFLEKNFIVRSKPKTEAGLSAVRPVLLKGVTRQECSDFLDRYLLEGSPLPENGKNRELLPIYIGKSLAEQLGVKPGDKLLLAGMDGNGKNGMSGERARIIELFSSLDLETCLVWGVYETGLQEGFDEIVAVAPLEKIQERFHPGMISGYDIKVHDIGQIEGISRNLAHNLGFPFYSYTVFERYANLFEWLKLQKNISPLLIITISVVAVFNIISTLLVLVVEKTREIGMLVALGLEPRKISRIFLGQSFLISLAGSLAGAALALVLTIAEQRFHLITLPEKSYFIKYVPLMLDPLDYVTVCVAVICLTLLFAFIPAKIASSLNPGTALTS